MPKKLNEFTCQVRPEPIVVKLTGACAVGYEDGSLRFPPLLQVSVQEHSPSLYVSEDENKEAPDHEQEMKALFHALRQALPFKSWTELNTLFASDSENG